MLLEILTEKEPSLREESEEIKDLKDPFLKGLILDMQETLAKSHGVGLAAPQIGKNIRLIVIKIWQEDFVLINPKIVACSREKENGEEGCLSLPGLYLSISRAKKVKVKAFLPDGKKVKIKAKGMLARVLQHEIDHLEGTLIKDRMN